MARFSVCRLILSGLVSVALTAVGLPLVPGVAVAGPATVVAARPVGQLGSLPSGTAQPPRKVVAGSGARPVPVVVPTGKGAPVTAPAAKTSAGFDAKTSRVASRSAQSTDYVNLDGTHTAVLSRDVVNFQAGDGSWQPVDNTVEPDPTVAGGLRSKANAWRAHFGDTSRGVSVDTAAMSVSMTPVGARPAAPAGLGPQVAYQGAFPGADLRYDVTGSAVKESILIASAGSPASYAFDIRAGAAPSVAAGKAAAAALALQSDGSVLVGDPAAGLRIAAPVVLRQDGAPVEEAKATLTVTGPGRLVVSVDPAWLAAQPASAFPITLDPSLGMNDNDERSYKSDGYTCGGCGVQFGNSRDNVGGVAQDRWWRSLAHYQYEQLFGTQYLSAAFHPTYRSGSSSPLGINIFWANAFSYAGAAGSLLAQGNVTNQWIGGAGLDSTLGSWISNGTSGGYFGFTGDERSAVYTYQRDYMDLYINYNHPPAQPGWAPNSPGNGGQYHQLGYELSVTGSDPDNDPLQYYFRAAVGSDAETGVVYNSGWQGSSRVNMTLDPSLWNRPIYWHVYVGDGYTTTLSPIWSFTAVDGAPTATAVNPNGGSSGPAVVSTTTPLLTGSGSDPNGDALSYNFTISGGADTPQGRASSGWISSPAWRVPDGVLEDGQLYTWTVTARDGGTDTAPWLTGTSAPAQLRVNLRLGASGPAPTDSVGGVTVGLANGNLTVAGASHGVTSLGGGLSVGLTYNSQAARRYGLLGAYYQENDRNWTLDPAETPALVRVDPAVDMWWAVPGAPDAPPGMAKDQFLARWTGYLTLPAGAAAGAYKFGAISDDGARIGLAPAGGVVDMTNPLYNDWTGHGAPPSPALSTSGYPLASGVPVKIQVEYFQQGGPGRMTLYVQAPDGTTQVVPSSWLSPNLSVLPPGWALSLPGGGGSYTRAATGNGVVVLTDGEGASHTYLAKNPASPASGYTPPAGEDGILAADPAGGFTLTDGDGSTYTFNAAGQAISARTGTDAAHPAAASYVYDTTVTPARVATIHDPVSGRDITLTYGPSGDPDCSASGSLWDAAPVGQLCKVSYWDGTTTVLRYKSSQLAAIQEPGAADGTTAGKATTQFGYGGGLLTTVRNALANDWILAGPPSRDVPATTSTTIGYTWVNPASATQETNVRPMFDTTGAPTAATPGAVPMVSSVTGPAPDGVTAAAQPAHAYAYTGGTGLNTSSVAVAGITPTAGIVTYDPTGRLLSSTTATGQTSAAEWDPAGRDLPTAGTDPAGRKTTTVYDWAGRATDTFGPAPASCFQADGTPVPNPPTSCGVIPHSHTGYDTNTAGVRSSGLALSRYAGINLSGQPAAVGTAGLDPGTWPATPSGSSTRLSGDIAPAPGTYTFSADITNKSDDGLRVYVGDQLVLDRWATLRQAVAADTPTYYWPLSSLNSDPAGSTPYTMPVAGISPAPTFTGSPVGGIDPTPTGHFAGGALMTDNTVTPGTDPYPSVEMWFKTTNSGSLLGQQNANDSSYVPILYIGTDGLLRGTFWSASGSTPITSPGTVTDGAWHHVVLSTSAATAAAPAAQSLYLDGQLAGSKANAVDLQDMTRMQVGYAKQASWPAGCAAWCGFTGDIGQVAIYNHPLGLSQAQAHNTAGRATLTGTTAVTFTAAPTIVAGTLPVAPASTPQRVRVEYRNPTAAAAAGGFTLKATPSGGTAAPVAASTLSTRYGLPTWHTSDDAGGLPGGTQTTATKYDGSGLDPFYGLATDTIADPAGLALDTRLGYETPGTGYLRPTTRTLPSGDPANPATRTSTSYYGDAATADNPCPGGAAGINQAGLPQFTTGPAPATGNPVQTQTVYDAAGRPVASRNTADSGQPGGGWACTQYDARGRATQVSIPASAVAPARTVTSSYTVGGDPLTTSVTDNAGTITTRVDLLGRTASYTDTTGTVTTTGYDLAGRPTSQASTGPGGGTSTLGWTYLDDGRVNTLTLDGATLATVGYDSTAEVTGVSYANGVSLGGLTKRPDGQQLAQTFTLPGSHTLTDTLTRSQTGRITRAVATSDTATVSDWTYGYDTAARLTTATLAATTGTITRPAVAYTYGYAATGGCGADTSAGKNGSRMSWTSQVGAGPVATTTACTDNASRLTSTTGSDPIAPGQAVYDGHSNATQLGNQAFGYDGADRVVTTTASTIPGTQTLTYTRDAVGRVVTRAASTTMSSGGETGTTRYAFTDNGDTPDFQLGTGNTLGERYLPLPGGVLYTKHYSLAGADSWAMPNLHGDITATCNASGVATLAGEVYDPYGTPITTTGTSDPAAAPTTRTGTGTTDAWHGTAQRGYEHTGGLNQILMGARTYLPTLGIFTSIDPIQGGNTTTYAYPQDPINSADLTGAWPDWPDWRTVGQIAVGVAAVAGAIACGATIVCGIAVGVAAGIAAYTVENAGTGQWSVGGALEAGLIGGITGGVLGVAAKVVGAVLAPVLRNGNNFLRVGNGRISVGPALNHWKRMSSVGRSLMRYHVHMDRRYGGIDNWVKHSKGQRHNRTWWSR